MSVLLLRLSAPLQSWGASSKFNDRMTEREPTKSGVIGLIASAMGKRRNETLDDLNVLKFGVRVDQPGKLLRDFHTAALTDGSHTFVSNRYYLADAVFLVGLEADDDLLNRINDALQRPMFPLFLGRRSCPPTGKVTIGIVHGVDLEGALLDLDVAPWQASDWYRRTQDKNVCLNLVMDAESGDENVFFKNDLPISFDSRLRKYSNRNVKIINSIKVENPLGREFHNPMEGL